MMPKLHCERASPASASCSSRFSIPSVLTGVAPPRLTASKPASCPCRLPNRPDRVTVLKREGYSRLAYERVSRPLTHHVPRQKAGGLEAHVLHAAAPHCCGAPLGLVGHHRLGRDEQAGSMIPAVS